MSYYALTGLINAVTSTFLGLIVYFTSSKRSINKSFGLFCLSVAIWSWAYIFWPEAQTKENSLFWFRALHVGAVLIPVTYFYFVITFLNIYKEKKRILEFGYLLILFFWAFIFTPFFIKDMVPKFSFRYWAEPGILYHFYLLMFFGYAVYCWYLLLKAYSKSAGTVKEQIKYILTGTLIGFLGGSTNYFLWYNIPIPPVGNGLVAVYVILIAYAITKHYLFGIKVILTELLVGGIALILLTQAMTAQTLQLKIFGFFLLTLFGIVGYFLIRSVLKEVELRQKLQTAYAELKKLDAAKSEFLSIASHQLRTPLTVIKGYISMMFENTYGTIPEKMRKPLENMYTSNERLLKLINGLLNASRIESGKVELHWEKSDMENIIDNVIEEMKIKAREKNLYLKLEKAEEENSGNHDRQGKDKGSDFKHNR